MPGHLVPNAHGWCLLWDWPLIITLVVSDGMIALAYFAIPWALFIYMRRFQLLTPIMRKAVSAFVVFISLCGLTHVMDIVTIWYPLYWLNAWIRVAAAIASMATAIFLYPALTLIMARRHRVEP